jgi:putative peptidoglycan lipid II flippase
MSNPTTPGDSPEDVGAALTGRQLIRTTSIIMGALVLSGVLGLARQMVISASFGAGSDLDAFYAALRVPETLFVLVAGGALGSAFIPLFSEQLAQDQFAQAWRLARATFTYMLLGALGLSVLCFVFADPIAQVILVPGAAPSDQALTAELMRIMLGTVVIFGISGLLMGLLNAHQHFLAPALAPSMYNLGLIIGALGLAPNQGVYGLAWGAVIGAGLHLLVQLPSLWRLPGRDLGLEFALRDSGAARVFGLMAPRVLGLGIVQINFWVNAALTSGMERGSLTALQTAFALMFTILGILGQSLGTAIFPTLSRLHAEDDHAGFGETLLGALKGVLFLSIPAGFGLAVLANPVISVLFERGDWTSRDTGGASWALMWFGIGLAGHAVLEILARAFYAIQDTWTPVKIGGLTMLLNITLSLGFITLYPDDTPFERGAFGLLALSMTLATAIESALLWWLLRRRISLQDRATLRSGAGSLVAALGMVAAVALWQWLGQGLPTLAILIGGMLLGAGVFGGLTWLLGLPEARLIPQLILRRLARR